MDHLGTPQVLTDQAQAIAWSGDYEAFGEVAVGVSAVDNPLRFPGQYYDNETNLHYNYFRDYDPSLGRYITSDPIGLVGGINTYGYVLNNPLKYIDQYGLDADAAIAAFPAAVAVAMSDSPVPGPMDLAAGLGLAAIALMPGDTSQVGDTTKDAANDDKKPAVGDNNGTAPSSCAAWKAVTEARRDMEETLQGISCNPNGLANINRDIGAYNASCGKITGKIKPLMPVF